METTRRQGRGVNPAGRGLFWALALVLLIPAALGAQGEDPHEFADVGCSFCHAEGDRESASGSEDLRGDVDARCAKCHPACVQGRKHRGTSATAGAMKTPLPLAREGRMACYTCHNPHGEYLDARTQRKSRYLRLDNSARELCYSCHRSGGSRHFPPARPPCAKMAAWAPKKHTPT
jgi:hypothetical protein